MHALVDYANTTTLMLIGNQTYLSKPATKSFWSVHVCVGYGYHHILKD